MHDRARHFIPLIRESIYNVLGKANGLNIFNAKTDEYIGTYIITFFGDNICIKYTTYVARYASYAFDLKNLYIEGTQLQSLRELSEMMGEAIGNPNHEALRVFTEACQKELNADHCQYFFRDDGIHKEMDIVVISSGGEAHRIVLEYSANN